MGDVTALMMECITEKSGHAVVPMAVSVCTTPAAPSPLPIPYPVVASSIEGIGDAPMWTKINGALIGTVGSALKTCHGNEPGTLKEVVSLNTTGPCFIVMGAPVVLCELGMMGITGSLCVQNKAPTPGASGSASDSGGTGGAGGGAGEESGSGGDGHGPGGPGGGGGASEGGSNSGASGPGSSSGRASRMGIRIESSIMRLDCRRFLREKARPDPRTCNRSATPGTTRSRSRTTELASRG